MMLPGGPRDRGEEAFESQGNISLKHPQRLTPGDHDKGNLSLPKLMIF